MATPPLPDDSGVLAGRAHDLPRADGNAVLARLDGDPLVTFANRESSSLSGEGPDATVEDREVLSVVVPESRFRSPA